MSLELYVWFGNLKSRIEIEIRAKINKGDAQMPTKKRLGKSKSRNEEAMDERTTKSKTKKVKRNFDAENLIPNYEFECPWCGAKYKFPLGREMKMEHCMKCHEIWIGKIQIDK